MSAVDEELTRIAESQHGLITRLQTLRAGGDDRFIARRAGKGQWERIGRSVYRISGSPKTDAQQLMAGVLAAGPRAVAARTSSAALCRLPGFHLVPVALLRPAGK